MRFIIRTLMFMACILQSAMPLRAGLAMSVPVKAQIHVSAGNDADHGDHSMPMAGSESTESAYPCPHRGTMIHAPHCAACLVLIPELNFAEKGRALDPYPIPDLQQAFLSNGLAPPVPPPRV